MSAVLAHWLASSPQPHTASAVQWQKNAVLLVMLVRTVLELISVFSPQACTHYA